jgi:arylsulfatase A-like enzyme
VLVTVDTLRRDRLSVYGYERPTSPMLRALARRSVVLDRAYAAHTNTAPSHATMLSGLHPGEHAVRRNGQRIDDGVVMLQERLKAAGYATGAFVSAWTVTRHTGLGRGFDRYDTDLGGDERRGDLTWKAAEPWLREHVAQGKPVFLWLHLYDPHHTYDPPPGFAERFVRDGRTLSPQPPKLPSVLPPGDHSAEIDELDARYEGEVAFADMQFGKLLVALEDLGAIDDSVILFTSDHGETLGERPEWTYDHGCRVFEEQVALPWVMQLPGKRLAGTRSSVAAHHVDVTPTLMDAAGLPVPEGMSGRSLLPALSGEQPGDASRPLFMHARPSAERVGLPTDAFSKEGLVTAVLRDGMKLIEYPRGDDRPFAVLYDLKADPRERKSVVKQHPELVRELHDELEGFRTRTGLDQPLAAAPVDGRTLRALRALGYLE